MKDSKRGGLIFLAILIASMFVGSYILAATFFGVLTLVGFIVLIESIPPLRWVLERSSRLFDVMIFIFTIMATTMYGLNITASLTVAGIGYTLIYGPYLREKRATRSRSKKVVLKNHINRFNTK